MKIKTGLEKMIDKNVFEKGLTKEEIEKRLYDNLHKDCFDKQKVKDAIEKIKDKWCMDTNLKKSCEHCDSCENFNDLKLELGL